MKTFYSKALLALFVGFTPFIAQAQISGPSTLCTGSTIVLNDPNTSFLSWQSSDPSIASIDGFGNVSGINSGSVVISYLYFDIFSGEQVDTMTVTVNSVPDPGYMYYTISTVCQGSTIILNESVSGGVWNSSDNTLAIVDGSGNVTGVAAGSPTISYIVTNGTCSAYAATTVYVNPLPIAGTITGSTSICIGVGGANLPLTDATPGGVWSSSNTSVVDNFAGSMYVFTAGTATISYTVTNDCGSVSATSLFTANAYPDYDDYQIVGTICDGSNTAYAYDLGTSYPSAVWVSGNAAIATIDSASGVITGISAGTVTISYVMVQGGCYLTLPATVLPLPNAGTISGSTSLSRGGGSTLTDNGASGGTGTWSSCNSLIAAVDGAGDINGIADGSTLISYTVSGICGTAYATTKVMVGNCTTATNISTFAGSHVNGVSGDGGAATAAEIGSSYGVVADGNGNVYISDYLNNVIRMVDASGNIHTIAGIAGNGGYNGDGIAAISAQLNGPEGMALDGLGNLYVADKFNERIRVINLNNGTIHTVAGNGLHGGWNGAGFGYGGQAIQASLDFPVAVALDCSGNIYISDQGSETIRKIDPSGIISNFAGTHAGGYNGDGIQATSAQLNNPSGITADCAGNVYIADAWNNRVRMVNAAGIITTIAGDGTPGYGGDGSPGGSAQLWIPTGVTLDACGDLYICDWQNNVVRFLTPAGPTWYISTFAGKNANDWHGYDGDGGPADSAYMYLPSSLAIDGIGNVYIADYGNYVVRELGTNTYTARTFANGTTQNMTVCENETAIPINSQLAIPDAASGKTETLSVSVNPLHGTLNGFSATATSRAGITTPTGLTYTPEAGYTGTDAFTVVMKDGTTAASTTVNVKVNPLPNAGTITGGANISSGNNITLADATGDKNGIWSSSNDLIASIDQSGSVTGAGNGIANISYTVTNGCGSKSATTGIVIAGQDVMESKALLFPNPNNGTFQCEFTSVNDCQLEIIVSDVTGRIVYKQNVEATTGTNIISVNLPANIQRPSLLNVALGNKNIKYPTVKITVTE